MTALLLLVVLLAALVGPQREDLVVFEAHHGYYGALLAGVGWWQASPALYWIGVVVLADDALQHAVQRFGRRPSFRSPLHALYALAYRRWAWLRRLNAWVDGG